MHPLVKNTIKFFLFLAVSAFLFWLVYRDQNWDELLTVLKEDVNYFWIGVACVMGINALRVVGKKMEDVHIVLNGPGAAGTAIIKMLMTAGAKDIIAVDQFGTLYKGCNSAEAHKNWLGEVTNPRQIKGGLKEAIAGADVFIGVSKPGILTTELCQTMNKDAIVFAMANQIGRAHV